MDSLDDYARESFEDVADEFTLELGLLWAEALLMADFSLDEQQQWQEKLAKLAGTVYGGDSFEIAVTAAEQGWTYPPLVVAMQGNIIEKGAWEDAVPDFADFLAEIRLRILAQRGKFQEYLNLAQTEGQFMLYLLMSVQQGQSDQANWFSNIDKVIKAVKADYPKWTFRQCQQRAEAIIDAGQAQNYHVAAEWLQRGCDILLSVGRKKCGVVTLTR